MQNNFKHNVLYTGSLYENCIDGKCVCKSGVGGEKCDRCEPGYWGLPKISSSHLGCMR